MDDEPPEPARTPGALPERGRTAEALPAELARLREGDLPVRGGAMTAYVYDTGRPGVHEAAARAHLEMLEVNCLDPTAFPSVVALERQVVAAVAERLGGRDRPGIFTSGGTESIMLAVKAARDAHGQPGAQLVVPATAHPAFAKAAHYLGLELVRVPVDPVTFRADPDRMAAALTPRTALAVVSAPSYAHGVVDPVAEIAALAAAAGVRCHVDACVGGWVLPWLREAGWEVPRFDLSVPGVTSISCDLHKYGYAPKGSSVVLFADDALRRRAYFAEAGWPGYPVINPTVQSSRGAGPLAAAWATFQALGAQGYRELAAGSMRAAERLVAGVAEIPELRGLRVLGQPDTPLVAIAADEPGLSVFSVADAARGLGWFFQCQLSSGDSPANLHFTLTAGVDVEALLTALAEAVAAARAAGPPDAPAELSEAIRTLDVRNLGDEEFAGLLELAGFDLDGGEVPMGLVNSILDLLPPDQREALIVRFFSVLYAPLAGPKGSPGIA